MIITRNLIKRPFMLLEVMICFMLVMMCALPLIYPHVSMYKEQKQFIHKIELDHAVNLIYADIIEKMHKNEISLANITSNSIYNLDESDLKKYRVEGFTGTYQFHEKHKQPNEDGFTVYLIDLLLTFTSKHSSQNLSYHYKIFAGAQGVSASAEPAEDVSKTGSDATSNGAADD